MSKGEILTPVVEFDKNMDYEVKVGDALILEACTFSDIIRYMMKQGCDSQEIRYLAEGIEKEEV